MARRGKLEHVSMPFVYGTKIERITGKIKFELDAIVEYDAHLGFRMLMDHRKTALERAFELARSGSCLSIRDIAFKLHAEKYNIDALEGPALKKQLMSLIEEAIKLRNR